MPDQNASNDPSEDPTSRREKENTSGTAGDEGVLAPPRAPRNDRLAALAETAKNYARAARANNTRRAYDADWRHFSSWLRLSERRNLWDPTPEAAGPRIISGFRFTIHGTKRAEICGIRA